MKPSGCRQCGDRPYIKIDAMDTEGASMRVRAECPNGKHTPGPWVYMQNDEVEAATKLSDADEMFEVAWVLWEEMCQLKAL